MSAARKNTPADTNGSPKRAGSRTAGAPSRAKSPASKLEIRRYVGAVVITGTRDQVARGGYWPGDDFPTDGNVKYVDSANDARYIWRVGASLYTVFLRDKIEERNVERTAKSSDVVSAIDVLSLDEFDGLSRASSLDNNELTIRGTKAAMIKHGAVQAEDFPKGRKTSATGERRSRSGDGFKWTLERVGRGTWALTFERINPCPASALTLSIANKSRVRGCAARLDERYQAFLAKTIGSLVPLDGARGRLFWS